VLAARISDQAPGGEILVSSSLRDLANGIGEFEFSEPRVIELKGSSGPLEVFAVAG
jgi:class 3 adenylate cyclase